MANTSRSLSGKAIGFYLDHREEIVITIIVIVSSWASILLSLILSGANLWALGAFSILLWMSPSVCKIDDQYRIRTIINGLDDVAESFVYRRASDLVDGVGLRKLLSQIPMSPFANFGKEWLGVRVVNGLYDYELTGDFWNLREVKNLLDRIEKMTLSVDFIAVEQYNIFLDVREIDGRLTYNQIVLI